MIEVRSGHIVRPNLILSWAPGVYHVRVYGYGFGLKDLRRHRKLLSDRNRTYVQFEIGGWLLTPCPPGDRGIRRRPPGEGWLGLEHFPQDYEDRNDPLITPVVFANVGRLHVGVGRRLGLECGFGGGRFRARVRGLGGWGVALGWDLCETPGAVEQ